MSDNNIKDLLDNSHNNSQRLDVSNNKNSKNIMNNKNNTSISKKNINKSNRNKVKNYNSMLQKPNVKLYLHSPFILLTLRLILISLMNYFLIKNELVFSSYFYRANFFLSLLFYISDYSNEKYLKLTYVYKNVIGNITDLSMIYFHTVHEKSLTNLYILMFLTIYFLRFLLDFFYYTFIVCDCSYVLKNTYSCININLNFTRISSNENNQNIHFLSTCVLNKSYIEDEIYKDIPILLFISKNEFLKETIRIICQFYFYEKIFFSLNLPYWFVKISLEKYLKIFFYFFSTLEVFKCFFLFKTLNSSKACISK